MIPLPIRLAFSLELTGDLLRIERAFPAFTSDISARLLHRIELDAIERMLLTHAYPCPDIEGGVIAHYTITFRYSWFSLHLPLRVLLSISGIDISVLNVFLRSEESWFLRWLPATSVEEPCIISKQGTTSRSLASSKASQADPAREIEKAAQARDSLRRLRDEGGLTTDEILSRLKKRRC